MRPALLSLILLLPLAAAAQKQQQPPPIEIKSGYDEASRSTVLHTAIVYVAADENAQHITTVTPGHEIVVIEKNGNWLRVFANTDTEESSEEPPLFTSDEAVQPASGWIKNKGVVGPQVPAGDAILFGNAAAMEDIASAPHAPKNAAQSAHLLYRRLVDFFPNSPLAGEASWRAADIRWQLEKVDISTLPSAHEKEAYLRPQIYDGQMTKIIKKYPKTKWSAYAAYEMLDNKLCGDWQGLPECPEKETGLYEKYVYNYPQGARSAEALYNAAYRQGVLVDMYKAEDNPKRSAGAAAHAHKLVQQLQQEYPASDFTARAVALAFKIDQGVAIYGNDRD